MRASVVVLNFNSGELIDPCLERLLAQQGVEDFEVVLVDNASTDGSTDRIARRLGGDARLRIVRSRANLGCSGGRNLGLAESRGGLIAFVDADAEAEPTWLAAVLAAASAPGVGLVASLQIYAANPRLLNGLGGVMNLQGYAWDVGFGEPVEFTQLPERALYACGNGLAVRREVVERVGGFEAGYFNYYEDVEFGLRARRAGFALALARDAVLVHRMGAAEVINRNKLWLCERNRIRTVLRHFPRRWLARWLVAEARLLAVADPVVPRRERARAWRWNLARLASLAHWRWGAARRLAPLAVEELLAPYWGYGRHRGHNLALRPDPARFDSEIVAGERGEAGLLYGWYFVEHLGEVPYRWSDGLAACALRVPRSAQRLRLDYCWPSAECAAAGARLHLVERGSDRAVTAEVPSAPVFQWRTAELELLWPAETVELLVETRSPLVVSAEAFERRIGLGVHRVAFD